MVPAGTCPSCGAPHEAQAVACGHCGAALPPTASSLPPPTVSTAAPPPPPVPAPAPPPGPAPVLATAPLPRNSAAMVTAALLAVIALVGIGLVLLGGGDDSSSSGDGPQSPVTYDSDVDPAALTANQVLLEPVNQPTVDPFTDDARLGPEEQPTVTLPDLPTTTVTTVAATSPGQPPIPTQVQSSQPGLYGGTRNNQLCDKEKMIAFLEANPDKAAAWAQVQGIAVADIRAYISALTPVVLTRDTLVTNHGFRNGQPYSHPSVLQAGSAVLVDAFGTPRAKCSCGNPLLPPPQLTAPPEYVGPQWPGIEPSTFVQCVPPPLPITGGITIVDLEGGELIVRPLGADKGTADLATGAIRITLTWGDTADLDLAVRDPDGSTIDFDVRSSASGGRLDVDANSGCEVAVPSPAENIVWADSAPPGQYVVQVNLYDDCGAGSSHAFQLQVLVGGAPVQLFTGDGSLSPTDGTGAVSLDNPTYYFVFETA